MLGNRPAGYGVGVGSLQAGEQQVLAVRRETGPGVDGRVRVRLRSAVQVHTGQLAGEVVVEQGFIVGIGQQILEGTGRRGGSGGFLNDRSGRCKRGVAGPDRGQRGWSGRG